MAKPLVSKLTESWNKSVMQSAILHFIDNQSKSKGKRPPTKVQTGGSAYKHKSKSNFPKFRQL